MTENERRIEQNSAEQKRLRENDEKLHKISKKIFELKTQLLLLEFEKEDLIKEHNELIQELPRYNQLQYIGDKVSESVSLINQALDKLENIKIIDR